MDDEKTIKTVIFSNIGLKSMKVDIIYDDNTFITDYPILLDDGHVVYDNNLPIDIADTIKSTLRFTREADDRKAAEEAARHGHPNWSHKYAYGPCTIESAF